MHTFHLWQVFLENVHPLLKVIHAPTAQQQLLKCSSNLSTTSFAQHALLLTIYANAVLSMTNDDCLAVVKEDRRTLIDRYTTGAQYALHRAGFLHSSDSTVLQSFVLYLVSVSSSGE